MSAPRTQRTSLVTGSSRGLGATIARHLAHVGNHVIVNGIDDAETHEVASSINDQGGVATALVADVTNPEQVSELVHSIEHQIGPIATLIINATGPQPEAPITEVTWTDHLDQLDFFAKSPVLLGARIIPSMIRRRHGRIINIDSEIAHAPTPGRSAYATAKNAQIGITLSWARELAPHGITVNTVAPGFIPVERHADLIDEQTRYVQTVPAGYLGEPSDIANAVAFFASDASRFVTGQRLVVDGGRSLNL